MMADELSADGHRRLIIYHDGNPFINIVHAQSWTVFVFLVQGVRLVFAYLILHFLSRRACHLEIALALLFQPTAGPRYKATCD